MISQTIQINDDTIDVMIENGRIRVRVRERINEMSFIKASIVFGKDQIGELIRILVEAEMDCV